jgi:replicative DNA helicase
MNNLPKPDTLPFDMVLPPYSRQAEEALIYSVLSYPDSYLSLDVEPEDFYLRRLRPIWMAFGKMVKGGVAVDVTTLTETLDRMGELDNIGGFNAIVDIVNNGDYFGVNAESYSRIVKDYARRRAWLDVAGKMARLAYDKEANLEQSAPVILTELSTAIRTRSAANHISQYTRLVLDEAYERMNNPQDIWGIPTGILDFDRITGGLQHGEILYLSGEPGVGKSMLAAQMAFQMAEKGFPGVVYSLEMPGTSVIRRRASHKAHIPSRAIKTGHISDDFPKLVQVLEAIDELPIYMSDGVDWTTTSLRADLARMKAQHNIQWFVLDYAYLLRDGIGLSENDRTGIISSQLKGICRSLDIAGIVIMSMNKSGMGGLPSGEALRGSNQQFYDTDLLLFIIRDKQQENLVRCIFGKGRELEQPKAHFELMTLPGFPAFENVSKKDINMQDWTK